MTISVARALRPSYLSGILVRGILERQHRTRKEEFYDKQFNVYVGLVPID